MQTSDVDPWQKFFEELGRPRPPRSQENDTVVALFADHGGAAYWHREMNRLVYLASKEGTRSQYLNRFVNLSLAYYTPDILGFQIEGFSTFAPRIWELLGRHDDERVSFDEILQYYEGLTIVTAASQGKAAVDFQLEKIAELRNLFGHITILRPDHAETIPL